MARTRSVIRSTGRRARPVSSQVTSAAAAAMIGAAAHRITSTCSTLRATSLVSAATRISAPPTRRVSSTNRDTSRNAPAGGAAGASISSSRSPRPAPPDAS